MLTVLLVGSFNEEKELLNLCIQAQKLHNCKHEVIYLFI